MYVKGDICIVKNLALELVNSKEKYFLGQRSLPCTKKGLVQTYSLREPLLREVHCCWFFFWFGDTGFLLRTGNAGIATSSYSEKPGGHVLENDAIVNSFGFQITKIEHCFSYLILDIKTWLPPECSLEVGYKMVHDLKQLCQWTKIVVCWRAFLFFIFFFKELIWVNVRMGV